MSSVDSFSFSLGTMVDGGVDNKLALAGEQNRVCIANHFTDNLGCR